MKPTTPPVSPPGPWQKMQDIVERAEGATAKNPAYDFKRLTIARRISENILALLLQAIGLQFSIINAHSGLPWLVTGIATALVFLRGYSVLPGIGLGSFFVFLLAKTGFSTALGAALILVAGIFGLVWVCHRYITATLLFYSRLTLSKFMAANALFSVITSTALVLLCYPLLNPMITQWQFCLLWSIANFSGVLIYANIMIQLDSYFTDRGKLCPEKKLKLSLAYGLLFMVIVLFALCHASVISLLLIALCTLSIIIYLTQAHGRIAAQGAVTLFAFTGTIAAMVGAPLFDHLASPLMLSLSALLSLAAFLALWISCRR